MTVKWQVAALAFALSNIATMTAQGPSVDRVMRKKLEVSQKILEAVVTSRWADLEARSQDLENLTTDPAWRVLDSPEYARQGSAFRNAVRTLREAARRHDLDAAPKAYAAVTASCVECHRYLARNRLAGK